MLPEFEKYFKIACDKFSHGEYQKSFEILQNAYSELHDKLDEKDTATYLKSTGLCYLQMNQSDKAAEYLHDSIKLFEALGDIKNITDVKKYLGLNSFHRGDCKQALLYFNEVEQTYSQEPESPEYASLKTMIGMVKQEMSDYGGALEDLLSSLRIHKMHSPKSSIANTSLNVGAIYFSLGQHDLAYEFYHEALNLYRELDDVSGISSALINLGNAIRRKDRFDETIAYYNEARSIVESQNDLFKLSTILLNIGSLYDDENRMREALDYYQRALSIKREFGHKKDLTTALVNVGRMQLELGHVDEALINAQEGLQIARSTALQRLIMQCHHLLARIFEKKGEYQLANENLSQYVELRDDVYNEETQQKIAEVQMKYEVEQKEREAELAKKDAEIYRLKTVELEERVQQELKRHQEQQQIIVQKSKLESLGQLAAGIAHEVNQPLTRISMGLDNILFTDRRGKLTNDFTVMKAKQFLEDTERIKLIIDHIKTFSRDQQLTTWEKVNLNNIVQNSLLLFNEQYRKHGVTVELELAEPLPTVIGHPFRLEQVLLNLIANARDAVDEQKTKTDDPDYKRTIAIRTRNENNLVIFEVEDNGTGIEEGFRDKVFEPFFTRKKDGKGTGLGLPVCYGIIKDLEGDITIDSEPGRGTRMTVSLPAIEL